MDRYGNISLLDILETFIVRCSIQNNVVQIDLDEKKVCVWLFLLSSLGKSTMVWFRDIIQYLNFMNLHLIV